ncbi:MAG: hypothetical protein RLZZ15_335, partial [Verrucomicrobiota bacterium]
MNAPAEPRAARVAGFRTKLLVAMALLVVALTALAVSLVERSLAAGVEGDLRRDFQRELAVRRRAEEIRQAALADRCRALVRKPRIHAALEDNALDLLYVSALDELRDVLEDRAGPPPGETVPVQRARFYRFLDAHGAVIAPGTNVAAGALRPDEEARLALGAVPRRQQTGYLVRRGDDGAESLVEIIAMPIISTASGEVIAALVLGFKPFGFSSDRAGVGLWLDGRLHLATPHAAEVAQILARTGPADDPAPLALDGEPHLLFAKQLNPGSRYPAASEVFLYSLADLRARQRQLRWQLGGVGALVLLVGLLGSQFLSRRLSAPVEKLAVDSERSARFSADASHQLKTPVAVLRAGLEELLAREKLTPEECAEISSLVHQTYRLSGLIEDLLLLSRLDAGRLVLDFAP